MLKIISQPPVKDYVPYSWGSLVHVKKEHYRALAHYFVAVGILDHKGDFSNKTLETLQFLHEEDEDKAATLIEIRVPKNQNERRYLGKPGFGLGISDNVVHSILSLRKLTGFFNLAFEGT